MSEVTPIKAEKNAFTSSILNCRRTHSAMKGDGEECKAHHTMYDVSYVFFMFGGGDFYKKFNGRTKF